MKKKYFCRTCKGLRNHQELYQKELTEADEFDYFIWSDKYCVIECLGCNTISFLKIYGDTEMRYTDEYGRSDYYFNEEIFPLYLEKGYELDKNYFPISIRNIYGETISAFRANLFILTAAGLRAIIEALCNHLKIRADDLSVRIDLLHKKGHLTLNESKRLHSIRFLGNDALHEMVLPKKEQLNLLLEIVNHLLSNLFINDKLIKGKIETVIDNYDEFFQLFKRKINAEMIGKEFTLLQILEKSRKLISKDKMIDFEKLLVEEILLEKHDFIKTDNSETIVKVTILKVPSVYAFIS
jgi:hypothetical protein